MFKVDLKKRNVHIDINFIWIACSTVNLESYSNSSQHSNNSHLLNQEPEAIIYSSGNKPNMRFDTSKSRGRTTKKLNTFLLFPKTQNEAVRIINLHPALASPLNLDLSNTAGKHMPFRSSDDAQDIISPYWLSPEQPNDTIVQS